VERQPEGVVRSPAASLTEAQRLLDAGMPFHAHEVFEDAWKSGPEAERELWRGLAQLAVGLTHAARGNTAGGARLLLRGADRIAGFPDPHGIDVSGLTAWARELAARVDGPVDAATESPRLTSVP
jgi:predicted metal-dependent hydrolase